MGNEPIRFFAQPSGWDLILSLFMPQRWVAQRFARRLREPDAPCRAETLILPDGSKWRIEDRANRVDVVKL